MGSNNTSNGVILTTMGGKTWLPLSSVRWIHPSCPFRAGYWSAHTRTARSILSAPENTHQN